MLFFISKSGDRCLGLKRILLSFLWQRVTCMASSDPSLGQSGSPAALPIAVRLLGSSASSAAPARPPPPLSAEELRLLEPHGQALCELQPLGAPSAHMVSAAQQGRRWTHRWWNPVKDLWNNAVLLLWRTPEKMQCCSSNRSLLGLEQRGETFPCFSLCSCRSSRSREIVPPAVLTLLNSSICRYSAVVLLWWNLMLLPLLLSLYLLDYFLSCC